jgi:hypothetical protein
MQWRWHAASTIKDTLICTHDWCMAPLMEAPQAGCLLWGAVVTPIGAQVSQASHISWSAVHGNDYYNDKLNLLLNCEPKGVSFTFAL